MKNFDLVNYLAKNKLQEYIELINLYPENPDEVAQKVADHFTETDDLGLIYSIKPGSLKMTSQGAYFDLNTEAGPNTPGEDFKDENGFGIENYLGDYAGGSFIIKSEEGLDEDFFVIRNMANRNAKVGSVTPEGEVIFTTETEMNEMNDLKSKYPDLNWKEADEVSDEDLDAAADMFDRLKESNSTEKMIKTYNIGKDTRLVFVGDSKTYYVKNIAPDRESVFVTIDGSTTFKKPLSKVTKVDGKMIKEMESNKMTREELKEMIRQNILNELAEEITEDTDMEFGDPDVGLSKLYADFYEGLEEQEEEVEDTEKVDVDVEEPAAAAPAEPTLTDAEREIQSNLDKALQAAQELGNEKLIQQIGNTITFFTRDFVVKEDVEQSDVESAITGKKLDLKKLEDATKKAMGGDSTDLTMFLAGVFEGKKEYYKDAEADDAEHIKALEKDMKDDKRSSMNESLKNKKIMKESLEILKMKKLAGLLSEGEYAKALLREENSRIDLLMAKLKKMSPQEFTDFVKKVGDYGIWSDFPNDIDPFNNISDRMEVISTFEDEDVNKYLNTLGLNN